MRQIEVLLVDDEPWVLMGLQKIFNWEQWGFHIHAAVSSSIEALSIIQSRNIDTVFSDIRMPDLSGLELLAKTHEISPELPFILISGFADFSYAQQALRQGAYDYLLKPVDSASTDVFLSNLSDHIRSLQVQKNFADFERLVKSELSFEELLTNMSLPYVQAYIVSSDKSNTKLPPPPTVPFIQLELGLHKCLYLCNTAENLFPYLKQLYSPEQNIGMSKLLPLQTNQNPVRQAEQALQCSFFTGSSGLFLYQATDPNLITSVCHDIVDAVSFNNLADIAHIFRSLPCERMNIEDVIFLWNRLHLQIRGLIPLEKEFYYSDSWQLQQDFKNWNSLLLSLEEMCSWNAHLENTAPTSQDGDIFKQMLHFIHDHYTEELYLKDLSEHFFLNFTYCCEFFKKNAGTTFSKYLTGLRMQKAADLLLHSSCSVEDICFQCGYNDYSYFNKAFKKEFSMTPFQYRKKMKGSVSGNTLPI